MRKLASESSFEMDTQFNPFVKTSLHALAGLCILGGTVPLIKRMLLTSLDTPAVGTQILLFAIAGVTLGGISMSAYRAFNQGKRALEFHLGQRSLTRAHSDQQKQEQNNG